MWCCHLEGAKGFNVFHFNENLSTPSGVWDGSRYLIQFRIFLFWFVLIDCLSDFDSTYRRTSSSYFDLFYFDLNVNLPFSFSFFFFWINCLLYFCVMLLTALIKWFQCFCLPVFKIEETMQESTKLLLNNWKVFENIFCAVDFGPRHWLTKTCFDFQRISEV